MTTKVNLPKWGMGIEEGVVVKWLRNRGDRVSKGEPLVEIETAKATQAVEAPVSGTLTRIFLTEGNSAPVNTTLAEIEEGP
jgi:pyruvate dehydrogenase E2 component (dihydrolipoamide acetyltransferase)